MENQKKPNAHTICFGIAALSILLLVFERFTDMQFFYLLPETVPEIILSAAAGIFLAAGLMIRRHFILGAIPGIIAAAVLLIGLGAADLHAQHITLSDSRIKGGEIVISRDDYLSTTSADLITADIPGLPGVLSWHASNSVEQDINSTPPLSSVITITDNAGGFEIRCNSQPVFSGTPDSGRLQKVK